MQSLLNSYVLYKSHTFGLLLLWCLDISLLKEEYYPHYFGLDNIMNIEFFACFIGYKHKEHGLFIDHVVVLG